MAVACPKAGCKCSRWTSMPRAWPPAHGRKGGGGGGRGGGEGGVNGGCATVGMGQRQHLPKEKPLGAGQPDGDPPRIRAARAPWLPAFRPACRRLRRLQDAASAYGGAGGGQAAGAGRQPLAPG